jgi:hypothetical protein
MLNFKYKTKKFFDNLQDGVYKTREEALEYYQNCPSFIQIVNYQFDKHEDRENEALLNAFENQSYEG